MHVCLCISSAHVCLCVCMGGWGGHAHLCVHMCTRVCDLMQSTLQVCRLQKEKKSKWELTQAKAGLQIKQT
jgi:hypothetical protein